MPHTPHPNSVGGAEPSNPALTNNLFSQMSSNSSMQVLSTMSEIIDILLKLQLQEQKQAYLNAKTTTIGAQAAAKAQTSYGEKQKNEALVQMGVAFGGALTTAVGLGIGKLVGRGYGARANAQEAQVSHLETLNNLPKTKFPQPGVGNMPTAINPDIANQKTLLSNNADNVDLTSPHNRDAVEAMTHSEYTNFKDALRNNITSRRQLAASLFQSQQQSLASFNTVGQLINSSTSAVGSGFSSGYKQQQGEQQANQTVGSQAQNAAAEAYRNQVQAMDKALSTIENIIQVSYQAAKVVPQQ